MTLQGGDREFGHGDQPTVVNNSGDTLSEGIPVEITGFSGDHATVEVATEAGDADGVTADEVADGDYIQMVAHGIVWVPVEQDVSGGDTVGEGGANGVFTDAETNYKVYEGNNSAGGLALIRFEAQ